MNELPTVPRRRSPRNRSKMTMCNFHCQAVHTQRGAYQRSNRMSFVGEPTKAASENPSLITPPLVSLLITPYLTWASPTVVAISRPEEFEFTFASIGESKASGTLEEVAAKVGFGHTLTISRGEKEKDRPSRHHPLLR